MKNGADFLPTTRAVNPTPARKITTGIMKLKSKQNMFYNKSASTLFLPCFYTGLAPPNVVSRIRWNDRARQLQCNNLNATRSHT